MMRRFLLPAFLVLIVLFLAIKNYSPGTYLTGWDSLHPEFNLSEAFNRVFSGAWRQEQGLGAVAAHSHMTELPRLLFVYLSSLVFAPQLIRWLYIFLCLALGPLGVFYFLSYVFRREREGFEVSLASFLGASFYLLNLGTLQLFFVPFEMFPTQFAFLPWLFYFALKILRENKKKNLLIFAVISFLASGMAYAPALFYAYFAALILFLFIYWITSKFSRNVFKKAFLIVFLVLLTNAFWLLPNIYSIKNQSKVISEAKINMLFSPEAFLRNVDSGDIKDVMLQKSFLFDWRVFDFKTSTFIDLMQTWKAHLSDQRTLWLGYALSGIAVLGALLALLKRNKVGLGLLAVAALSLFFLININYATGGVYKYLYDNFDVFKEGFRMPFTKFSILFELVLSFFFGYFFLRLKKLSLLAAPFVFTGLIFFMLPAFRGNLTSEVVKKDLPREYTELFSWFKGKEGRIAEFPLYTLWGWDYHEWGYQGSGLLTYGLSNPLLVRDFDRWSPYNESFFNEASRAVYAQDGPTFEAVLQKYQVKYLLLDESIINAGGSPEPLFIPQIKSLIASSTNIKQVQKIGFLTVYETNFDIGDKFVSIPATFGRFDTDSTYSQSDPVYTSYGNYVNDSEGTTFPFVNFDKRMGVSVGEENSDLVLDSNRLQFSGKKELTYPELLNGGKVTTPAVFVNGDQKVQVSLPVYQKTSANLVDPEQETRFQNCDLNKLGMVQRQNADGKLIHFAASGGVACEFFNFPDISHSAGYLLHIKGENVKGRSLKIYLQNWQTNRMDLEELLPSGTFDEYYFILPTAKSTEYRVQSTKNIEGGYSLNLETRSFGRIASENVVEKIEFIPVPVEWLQQIRLEPNLQGPALQMNNLQISDVKKWGTWLYKVETEGSGLLELGQGFESGWIAFTLIPNTRYQIRALPHVRVNSWANGFLVENSQSQSKSVEISTNSEADQLQPILTVYLVFWPQLLEYLGFVLIPLSLILILSLTRDY